MFASHQARPGFEVAFNRPDSLNAINGEMHTELSEIFADIAKDSDTHAVVITGNGRAFCAGGDIKWFQHMTPTQLDTLFTEARKIIIDLLELEQPVIAAINAFLEKRSPHFTGQ